MSDAEGIELKDGERYEGLRLSGRMLAGLRISHVEFEGCLFERCRMNEATLHRSRLLECRFEGCDLSGARLINSGRRELDGAGRLRTSEGAPLLLVRGVRARLRYLPGDAPQGPDDDRWHGASR